MINIDQSSKEINYNFDIMETTLKKGISVDIGFIQIFAQDIENLNTRKLDTKVITPLQGRLEKISQNLYKILDIKPSQPLSTLKDVEVPFIRPIRTMLSLANEYQTGPIKKGLEELETSFAYHPIKGDGHCLFRALAAGILYQLQGAHPKTRVLFNSQLFEVIAKLGNPPELVRGFALFTSALNSLTLGDKSKTLLEMMSDPTLSDGLVAFLRQLACQDNKANPGEIFENEAIATRDSKEHYLSRMADMSKAELGGDIELIALSRSLGINVRILHAEAIGKGKGEEARASHHFFGVENRGFVVPLLYRPGHYDLAVYKN